MRMQRSMKGRDFLTLRDFTKEEIMTFLQAAIEFKQARQRAEFHDHLAGKKIFLLFARPSTRTRTSFQVGVTELGGQSYFLSENELQMGRGELVKDTARVMDRFCDALVIRTDDISTMEEFAKYMGKPVINALALSAHPCQGLADLLTILEKKRRFSNLKMAYIGTLHGVASTLSVVSAIMGMDFYAVRPEGYELPAPVIDFVTGKIKETKSKCVFTSELEVAVTDADIIYGNTFHPARVQDKEKRIHDFLPYQITEQVMRMAKDDALFMHCLPAYRDEEVTDAVIEGPWSVVWDEAENRLHTEKAILTMLVGGKE